MAKKSFKISMEIEVEAKNPLQAAKMVEGWIRKDGGFQYYVQDDKDNIFSVDLSEEDKDAVLPAKGRSFTCKRLHTNN